MHTTPDTLARTRIRVWDLPTRVFHWALAASVLGLAVTGTIGGSWMNWHFRLGYGVLALLLFRLVWGMVGGRWSRFSAFLYAPKSLMDYLGGRGRPEHSVGHTPLGAASVFALLGVLMAQAGSGLLSDDEIAFAGPLTSFVPGAMVELATWYHSDVGKWMVLGLVLLHLVAIAVYSWRRHALVSAMLHGDKEMAVDAHHSRDDAWSRATALLVLALCGSFVYWMAGLSAPAF